ncbi:MAG: PAN domain-containing protein [Pseudomonadota bacterium]
MRHLLTAALLAAAAAGSYAEDLKGGETAEVPVGHLVDEYRFGGTYAVIDTGSPTSCQARCNMDDDCLAWSFTSPSPNEARRCELKATVGNAEIRPGTVSGISRTLHGQRTISPQAYNSMGDTVAAVHVATKQSSTVTFKVSGEPTTVSRQMISFDGDPDLKGQFQGSYRQMR